ncbi:MAG TPA: hypothetical protein VI386_26570 [Candidatus Sulfotelmatobacter sp.]
MANLLTDFQLAMRRLIQSPGISFVILLTLILGIGATTTVFSLVDAVILKPLPYSHPEQLVEVEMVGRHGYEPSNISYPDFFDLRSQNHSLSHLVSYHDKWDESNWRDFRIAHYKTGTVTARISALNNCR